MTNVDDVTVTRTYDAEGRVERYDYTWTGSTGVTLITREAFEQLLTALNAALAGRTR